MTQIEELKAESKNEIDRFRAERDILKLKFDQAQDAIESQRQRMSETERNRERVSSQLEILRNELSTHRAEANARTQSLEAANRELSSHVQVLERILEQYRNRPSSNSDGKKTKPPAPGTAPEAAKLRVVSRDGDPS
jgi:predicted RNA-binding Zn ribbon-like protein